ncbi:MAG TPA: acyltransferase family protein [Xanthobacteraceae bacterium]|nr:acyltransferase family protein [Xanthobacteraceae bacterium]
MTDRAVGRVKVDQKDTEPELGVAARSRNSFSAAAGPLPSPYARKYRPDIDGLRAFAVLAVVLYHAFPEAVPGGYVGVDIFFVISGFLISSILFTEIKERRFSFAAFYGRRIRRIFPALAVCLAVVLAYGILAMTPSELAQLGKHAFFGAGFLSNIALWYEAGYFDAAATSKPLLHLWSLGIEEQFYILWPMLLWGAFRKKANLGRLLVILFVASFGINVALSITNLSDAFYLPISRFWELLAGAGLAWIGQFVLAPNIRSWISVAGLAALLTSVALFTSASRFPGWIALLPVAGTVAVIAAGPGAAVNRILFSNRTAVAIGFISYPLYIWHWPLISYAYIIRLGKPPTPLMAMALVAASFVLAWATYRFIECPVRFGTRRHRRTLMVASCVAALGACGMVVWAGGGFPERFPSLPGVDVRKIGNAKLDADFKPTAGMAVTRHDWTLVAHLGDGEDKVALAGDSLLFQYGPRVQQLFDEGRLAANTFFVTGPRCPPVPGVMQPDKFARCVSLPGILVDLVQREKVQAVVLGAAWAGYSTEGMVIERKGRTLPLNTAEGSDAFYANLEDHVRLLQANGAKVYLVLAPPAHERFDPGRMVTRGLTGFWIAPDVEEEIPVAALRAIRAAADARLRAISERTGASLLDPFPDVCGSGATCSPFFGAGEPKFSDLTHLRPAFVRQHLRFLDPLLE